MSTWMRAESVLPGRWAGLGDSRRYLLSRDDRGYLWPWVRLDNGWQHTLDLADGVAWQVHEVAHVDDLVSLARHIRLIPEQGCGGRGWCGHHEVSSSES